MPDKEPTFFERAKASLRTMAFNRGVHLLQKSGDAHWKGPDIWKVEAPNENLHFFKERTAIAWADRHNVPPDKIRQIEAHYSKPHVLRWYAKQKALGMNIGSDAQHIISAGIDSVDDMIAWYKGIKTFDTAAAFSLLKLGFAADRPDATTAVADVLKAGPWFWLNDSHMSGETGDPFALRPGNEAQMCLFARCMSSVALTQWLFEHQPHLKDVLLQPEKWDEIQKGLEQSNSNVQAQWPWVAHHIFGIDVSPVDYDPCLQDLGSLLNLHDSFAHDPAAQCYISYNMIKTTPWVHPVPQKCVNPHASTFHEKMMSIRNSRDPSLLPSTAVVDNLMLAVQLDLDPSDFYLHAKFIFRSNGHIPPQPDMDIDNNLFG